VDLVHDRVGTPIPTSGNAIREHPFIEPWARRIMSVAAASVASGPFGSGAGPKKFFFAHQVWGIALFVTLTAVMLAVVAAALRAGWRRRSAGRDASSALAVAVLAFFVVVLLAFYSWFGFSSYLTRYLAPAAAATTLLVAVLFARAWPRPAARALAAVVGVALLGIAVTTNVNFFRARESARISDAAVYAGLINTGYRDAVKEAVAFVPRGARVAAWQSGALAYYADRRLDVVNLDGVVNVDAPPIDDAAAMAAYIRDRNVGWLADWAALELSFVSEGRFTLQPAPGTKRVGSFRNSSGVDLVVVRIAWDMAEQLQQLFDDEAADLVAFQRATQVLTAGEAPSRATCLRLVGETLPAIASRSNLEKLSALIPDDELSRMMRFDVEGKYRLLFACAQPQPLDQANLAGVALLHERAGLLRDRLAQHGLSDPGW
jgi:hypothetical protein